MKIINRLILLVGGTLIGATSFASVFGIMSLRAKVLRFDAKEVQVVDSANRSFSLPRSLIKSPVKPGEEITVELNEKDLALVKPLRGRK